MGLLLMTIFLEGNEPFSCYHIGGIKRGKSLGPNMIKEEIVY